MRRIYNYFILISLPALVKLSSRCCILTLGVRASPSTPLTPLTRRSSHLIYPRAVTAHPTCPKYLTCLGCRISTASDQIDHDKRHKFIDLSFSWCRPFPNMATSPQIEARSLSAINSIAANPPQYPHSPEVRESLTLYISRVPGTRGTWSIIGITATITIGICRPTNLNRYHFIHAPAAEKERNG